MIQPAMQWTRRVVAGLGFGIALLAQGAGGGADAETSNQELTRATDEIHAGRYDAAARRLERYTLQFNKDANGWNWLGFAYRKLGRLDLAFERYQRALALDPGHRGAHEYIGEAYLQANRPEEAERHLRRLEELCRAGCEELDDLRLAVTAYRARGRTP